MYGALSAAVVLFVLASFCPGQMVGLFTTDVPIIEAGVEYLGIIRFTYLFFAVTQIPSGDTAERGGQLKIAFQLSVMAFCVNCGINYVLIFGKFGAPEMGIRGAAIGTLAARVLELIVLLVYISVKEVHLRLKLSDYFHPDGRLSRDYIRITAPMLMVQGLWGINTALQTAILGSYDGNRHSGKQRGVQPVPSGEVNGRGSGLRILDHHRKAYRKRRFRRGERICPQISAHLSGDRGLLGNSSVFFSGFRSFHCMTLSRRPWRWRIHFCLSCASWL